MKFALLIAALAVLTPCCLAWSSFTSEVMGSISVDPTSYFQYTTYLFPDISSDCQNLIDITSQYSSLSTAAIDWIVNTRQNYVPFCSDIQDMINTAKSNTEADLTAAVTTLSSVGDEIEWGYNFIQIILANKGCTQDIIDSYNSVYSSNLTMVLQQINYWNSMLGMINEIIPYGVIQGFYQTLANVMMQEQVSPVKMIRQAELMSMGETTRIYRTSTAYAEWYVEGINQATFYSTKVGVERLVDGAVLQARSMVC